MRKKTIFPGMYPLIRFTSMYPFPVTLQSSKWYACRSKFNRWGVLRLRIWAAQMPEDATAVSFLGFDAHTLQNMTTAYMHGLF